MILGETNDFTTSIASFLAPMAQRVDQHREGRRGLTAARITEVIAGKARTPLLQHADQSPGVGVCLHLVLGQIGQAEPGVHDLQAQADIVEHDTRETMC